MTEPAPRNDDTKKPEPTQDGDERPPDPRIGTPDDVSKTAPNEGDASADGRPIEKGEVTEREFSDYSEVKNPRQRAFLVGFRQSCNVRTACELAKVSRRRHNEWLHEDEVYAAAFERAKDEAIEVLEAEVRRRAVEGVVEPTGWYKGSAGGYVRRYSDILLMFYLKGLAPDKYRERVEWHGSLAKIDLTRCTDEQIQRIAAGEDAIAVLATSAPPLLGPGPAPEPES